MFLCICKHSSAVEEIWLAILGEYDLKKKLTVNISRVDTWCLWIFTFVMPFNIFLCELKMNQVYSEIVFFPLLFKDMNSSLQMSSSEYVGVPIFV